MRIVRNPFSFLRHVRNFVVVADHDLCQFKAVRWLCGGTWFKSYDSWKQCDRITIQPDGTSYMRYQDISFHETHNSVQGIEDYT